MTDPDDDYTRIRRRAGALGLIMRGGFSPEADDGVPPLPDGRPARTVVLLGNTGESMWPVFSRSPEATDGRPHPLDPWSRRVIGDIAARFDGSACFPDDGPPWPPFVAWAKRAEAVTESPIGILVHPDYGLWHAWRAGPVRWGRNTTISGSSRRCIWMRFWSGRGLVLDSVMGIEGAGMAIDSAC